MRKYKYLLIYYEKLLKRNEEEFETIDGAHYFIFDKKIKDYRLYKMIEDKS